MDGSFRGGLRIFTWQLHGGLVTWQIFGCQFYEAAEGMEGIRVAGLRCAEDMLARGIDVIRSKQPSGIWSTTCFVFVLNPVFERPDVQR